MQTFVQIFGERQTFAKALQEILDNEEIEAVKGPEVEANFNRKVEEEVATREVAKEGKKSETQNTELEKSIRHTEAHQREIKPKVESSPFLSSSLPLSLPRTSAYVESPGLALHF